MMAEALPYQFFLEKSRDDDPFKCLSLSISRYGRFFKIDSYMGEANQEELLLLNLFYTGVLPVI